MFIEKIVYQAHATATGGREGRTVSSDGSIDLKLTTPKQLGGSGLPGANPEQLFAAGYAACFIGAMRHVAGQRKVSLPSDISIDATVGIGAITGGFGIEVDLKVHVPGMAKEAAQDLIEAAHRVCPYSNATRNNIDVRLSVD